MGRNALFESTKAKDESYNREIFVLDDAHIKFLRDLCYKVSSHTGYKLKKTEIVRALLDIALSKKIDPQKIEDYEDLKSQLK